jgi:hypothetical protein
MTKHNAEMESNKEQSRVCARLPLNLQLFAEDTGENGADTNAEGAAGDTDANSDGDNDTPTFDDLLKDSKANLTAGSARRLPRPEPSGKKAPKSRRTKPKNYPV